MQLSAALEFAMEAPLVSQLVYHQLWHMYSRCTTCCNTPQPSVVVLCCIGYANAAIVQQVYHLLDICCRCTTCSILWVVLLFVDRKRCTTFCLCKPSVCKWKSNILLVVDAPPFACANLRFAENQMGCSICMLHGMQQMGCSRWDAADGMQHMLCCMELWLTFFFCVLLDFVQQMKIKYD